MKEIQRATKLVGSQTDLAKALGLKSQSQISQWLRGRRPVPPKWCIRIETVTGGAVTRYQLRPDVFGSVPDGELKKAG